MINMINNFNVLAVLIYCKFYYFTLSKMSLKQLLPLNIYSSSIFTRVQHFLLFWQLILLVVALTIYRNQMHVADTAQKMKFFIKDFFSKCDQIRSFLWIWSHLLKKSLMKSFMFCALRKQLIICI